MCVRFVFNFTSGWRKCSIYLFIFGIEVDCAYHIIYLTRMKTKILILVLFLSLIQLAHTKPVYDFKTSYLTQLTDFNFKDQVTKIRQNTNYVAVVQFYKYNGNI